MTRGTVTEQIALVADPRSVRTARHWALELARSHGLDERARWVVELLTSELATNAVRHTVDSDAMTVSVLVTEDRFVVAVRDDDPMPPTLSSPPAGAPGGRGVALVARLSTQWGVDDEGPAGKRVWFAVARTIDSGEGGSLRRPDGSAADPSRDAVPSHP